MVAVFNAPEHGDSNVARDAKTSDRPQFDIQSLYSEMGSTLRDNTQTAQSNNSSTIEFPSLFTSRQQNAVTAETNSPERTGAMAVANQWKSFEDSNNNVQPKLDAQDVFNGVQVMGDMDYMKDALKNGNTKDAQNWLGEMQRDMTAFTQGLTTDSSNAQTGNGSSDGHQNHHERHHHEHHGRHHHQNDSTGSGDDQSQQNSDSGSSSDNSCPDNGGSDSSCPPSQNTESGSEGNSESGSENNQSSGESGLSNQDSSGYTAQDSMVLIANDMQQLSSAMASGDTALAQQIMERMSRHFTNLLNQLNPQGNSQDNTDGTANNGNGSDGQTNFNPLDPGGFLGSLDGLTPRPGEGFPRLPNPGDLFGSLPQPGDLLNNLPKPPNPADLLRDLPKPPNPGDLLSKLPSPGDIFGGLF